MQRNIAYLLNITFIFGRCHHSKASVILVNKMWFNRFKYIFGKPLISIVVLLAEIYRNPLPVRLMKYIFNGIGENTIE